MASQTKSIPRKELEKIKRKNNKHLAAAMAAAWGSKSKRKK